MLSSNKGRTYDVLVGISGGKDSCYVAYLAKKKYNLRVLGVLYDFPFMRDLARENARNVCRTLGIELEIIKTRKSLEFDLLKNHMCAMAGTGTTWGQCLFCHYGIDAVLYGLAKKKGIPLVLGGVTSYELWNPGKRMGFLKERVASLSLPAKIRFAAFQLKALSDISSPSGGNSLSPEILSSSPIPILYGQNTDRDSSGFLNISVGTEISSRKPCKLKPAGKSRMPLSAGDTIACWNRSSILRT